MLLTDERYMVQSLFFLALRNKLKNFAPSK